MHGCYENLMVAGSYLIVVLLVQPILDPTANIYEPKIYYPLRVVGHSNQPFWGLLSGNPELTSFVSHT